MLTATDLFMGADALYVNMSSRELYKLEIVREISEKEMDDYVVLEHRLTNYMAFDLGEDNGSVNVAQMCELENRNEDSTFAPRLGYSDVLLCVVFADCTVKVYDTVTGELLRELNRLPAPFEHNNLTQCEVLTAAVRGDQLLIVAEFGLAGGGHQSFRGPVLLYLDPAAAQDEKLDYCKVRAKLHMPRDSVGALCAASICDQETLDIVSNQHVATHEYQVRNLTLLNEQEILLNELAANWHCLPRSGADQRALAEKMLDLGLYSQLAEYVLLEDRSVGAGQMMRFQATEKGALKTALDWRLQE